MEKIEIFSEFFEWINLIQNLIKKLLKMALTSYSILTVL